MFYEHALATLNGNRSTGWLHVATSMQLSMDDLRLKLIHHDLTFEQCIELTQCAGSPELLTYVLGLFDSDFGFRNKVTTGSGSVGKPSHVGSRMH